MTDRELCFKSATELRRLIDAREVSAVDVLEAHLAQIDAVNPHVNAIVTLVPEHAERIARDIDARLSRGDPVGPLAGLPIAHKDLVPTKGIRTTYGSRIHASFVPDFNALIVDRLLAAGAVTLGKTNTPEWGAGSQTFNEVFGATHNPYDLSKTCGGSSGGAATALASRMIPIADGSDTGGSLRNPANFCNVVGFRPSPGRVPRYPASVAWSPLSVTGPMARTVEDCALLLSAMAGPDPRSPIAIEQSGDIFRSPLERDVNHVRIAFSPDFAGQVPVADDVVDSIDNARRQLESLGCKVDNACPDFSGADDAFKVLRAWNFAIAHKEGVAKTPELYKDTIRWNTEQGLALTGEDIARAELLHTALYHRIREFMQDYEFLVLPVSQVAPFDLSVEWIREINGIEMETYIDWMKSCYYISVPGLPAISVPAGFTESGLPVGLQIVGRHHADLAVLQLAHAFEQATRYSDTVPAVAAP
ncbi:MAG TPA: amidase [Pseudomonadales bacterium]|nr:amidase [Pseudomonadales bacterium]